MKKVELELEDDLSPEYDLKSLRVRKLDSGRKSFGGSTVYLQQLLIKPTTRRVAGRSPAIGFIFLFVADLKANSCNWILICISHRPYIQQVI